MPALSPQDGARSGEPVRERPMIFSAPMVRALLREAREPGTGKTQTRRILLRLHGVGPVREFGCSTTPGYDWHYRDRASRWHDVRDAQLRARLPYAAGDRLWVKEAAHRAPDAWAYSADGAEIPWPGRATMAPRLRERSSPLFLPRVASRLTLTVTEVRVQRLQDISEEDARAEGANCSTCANVVPPVDGFPSYRSSFGILWNNLHGPDAWQANPWIVALTFSVALPTTPVSEAQAPDASDRGRAGA